MMQRVAKLGVNKLGDSEGLEETYHTSFKLTLVESFYGADVVHCLLYRGGLVLGA